MSHLHQQIKLSTPAKFFVFLILYLAIKIIIFIGLVSYQQAVGIDRTKNIDIITQNNFFDLFGTRWDSNYYIKIATEGYTEGIWWAFPPGYPHLIRLFNVVLPFSPTAIAVIVAQLMGLLSLWLFWKITQFYSQDDTIRLQALTLYAFFPHIFVYSSVAYSESTFLCALLLSWYFYQKAQPLKNGGKNWQYGLFWLGIGMSSAYTALTRYAGLLLLPIYGIFWLYPIIKNYHLQTKTPKQWDFIALILFLIPFILPLRFFFDAYTNGLFGLQQAIWGQTTILMGAFIDKFELLLTNDQTVLINYGFAGLIVLATLYAAYLKKWTIVCFNLPFLLLYFSTTGIGSFAVGRYSATLFLSYIVFAQVIKNWYGILTLCYLEIMFGIHLLYLFISWRFWG